MDYERVKMLKSSYFEVFGLNTPSDRVFMDFQNIKKLLKSDRQN